MTALSSQQSTSHHSLFVVATGQGTQNDLRKLWTASFDIVRITGINQWNNLAGVINSSWECVVESVSVPSTPLNPTTPENRLLSCEKDGLSDRPHVITVNAILTNQTFWFDYVQYLPSFQYGTGWSAIFPGNMTAQTGSTFSFEFNDISLTWLGFYDNTLTLAAITATYEIDGQSPLTFNLNRAAAEGIGVQYNQFFSRPIDLPLGSHKLDVIYQGNSKTAPLILYELFLQDNASSTVPLTISLSSTTSEFLAHPSTQ